MRKEISRTPQGEKAFNDSSANADELRFLGLLMTPRSIDELYNLLGQECEPMINSLLRRGWIKKNEGEKIPTPLDNLDDDSPLARLRRKMEEANSSSPSPDEVLRAGGFESGGEGKNQNQSNPSPDPFSSNYSDEPRSSTIVSPGHETGLPVIPTTPKVSKKQIEQSLSEFNELFGINPSNNDLEEPD